MCLSQSFYANDTVMVAQALLGKKLVRMIDGQALSGMVVETEAYVGVEDSACHAAKGRTARTEVMFGPPGCLPSGKVAYIYIIYGIHYYAECGHGSRRKALCCPNQGFGAIDRAKLYASTAQ